MFEERKRIAFQTLEELGFVLLSDDELNKLEHKKNSVINKNM